MWYLLLTFLLWFFTFTFWFILIMILVKLKRKCFWDKDRLWSLFLSLFGDVIIIWVVRSEMGLVVPCPALLFIQKTGWKNVRGGKFCWRAEIWLQRESNAFEFWWNCLNFIGTKWGGHVWIFWDRNLWELFIFASCLYLKGFVELYSYW